MDRFKFRAWDAENSIMWIGTTALDCLVMSFKFPGSYKHFIFMLSTGILDKNGKKIFEGDIVLAPNNNRPKLVVWDKRSLSFKLQIGNIEGYYSVALPTHKYEVIGNVFEHPELLKEVEG